MDVGDPILAEDMVAVRLTSNFALATSSTTLQDVTGLVVPVVANAVYIVEMSLQANNAAGTTEDVKYGVTFPTGATCRMSGNGGTPAGVSGSVASDMNIMTTTFTSGSTTLAFGASNTTTEAGIRGILTMGSTAGNFQVQAAQNTSGVNATSVMTGSYILLTRIA